MNMSDLEGVKTKVCSKCKIEKLVKEFHKDSSSKDGLNLCCKVCNLEKSKKWRKANSHKIKEYNKKYHKTNSDKAKKYHKEWRKSNPNYGREYGKANSERVKEYRKDYQKANYDKIKERWKEYTKANPDKINAHTAKRRSKKLQATPPWLTKEHLSDIRAYYTKSKALEESTGIKHHVDHIVPLQGENVCGLHVPWNLQVLTASENLAKKNSYPDEWEDT